MWDVGDDNPACGVVGWDSVHELLYGMGTFGHRLMGNVICTTCHYDGVTIRNPRHVGDVVSEPLGGGTRISIADGWKLFAINHGAKPSHHRAPNDNQTFLMPRSSGSIDTVGRGLCNWWFGCATTPVCTCGVIFGGALPPWRRLGHRMRIYILIRVCDSSSDPHGPLIANPSGCLKSMWASHVTSRVKVCLYNEIRTHQPILFLYPSRLVSPAAILSTAMTYKLRNLTPADLT